MKASTKIASLLLSISISSFDFGLSWQYTHILTVFVTLLAHLHRSAGVTVVPVLAALIVMAGEVVLAALGGYRT